MCVQSSGEKDNSVQQRDNFINSHFSCFPHHDTSSRTFFFGDSGKRSGAALRIIFAIASGNSFLTVVKLAKSDIGNCQNCFLLFWPFRGDFYQFAQFFSTPCNQVSNFWSRCPLTWLNLLKTFVKDDKWKPFCKNGVH